MAGLGGGGGARSLTPALFECFESWRCSVFDMLFWCTNLIFFVSEYFFSITSLISLTFLFVSSFLGRSSDRIMWLCGCFSLIDLTNLSVCAMIPSLDCGCSRSLVPQ